MYLSDDRDDQDGYTVRRHPASRAESQDSSISRQVPQGRLLADPAGCVAGIFCNTSGDDFRGGLLCLGPGVLVDI